jgi:hypothetical protein
MRPSPPSERSSREIAPEKSRRRENQRAIDNASVPKTLVIGAPAGFSFSAMAASVRPKQVEGLFGLTKGGGETC